MDLKHAIEWHEWWDQDKTRIDLLRSEALETIANVVQERVGQLWRGSGNGCRWERMERRTSEISG